jgi:hypothetical protein
LNAKVTEHTLGEQDVDFAESFLDSMLSIYPLLGIKAFEAARQEAFEEERDATEISTIRAFQLEVGGLKAQGWLTSEGFRVSKGSTMRKSAAPKLSAYTKSFRARLLLEQVVEERGENFEFARDYDFSSPSQAASVILGSSASGPAYWHLPDGKSLKEYREELVTMDTHDADEKFDAGLEETS